MRLMLEQFDGRVSVGCRMLVRRPLILRQDGPDARR